MNTKKIKEEYLLRMTAMILHEVRTIREWAKRHDLLNTQIWIDFEDKLNLLSVEDPEK